MGKWLQRGGSLCEFTLTLLSVFEPDYHQVRSLPTNSHFSVKDDGRMADANYVIASWAAGGSNSWEHFVGKGWFWAQKLMDICRGLASWTNGTANGHRGVLIFKN